MKKNTYDVPGYKVGIIVIPNSPEKEHEIEDYQKSIDEKKAIIVPFEDVDGLFVNDVLSLLQTKSIFVQFYSQYQNLDLKNHNQMSLSIGRKFGVYIFIGNILEENLTMPIDELVGDTIEELYDTLDDEQKRYAHCFFERYQDKNYKATKKRIKRLQRKKN